MTDPADVTWLQALVWPEHTDRHALLADSIPVVCENPPEVITGDVFEHLSELVHGLPADSTPVVYNTQVLYQFTEDQRERFTDLVRDISREKPFYWVSGEDPHPDYDEIIALSIAHVRDGTIEEDVVTAYQPHGRWIAWPATD